MVYGRGSSTTHIAVYFGKFSSIGEVKSYLEDLGLYKSNTLKKVSGNKYQYNGKTVIRKYGNSSYWRIHSTCSGIMIDNDIDISEYLSDKVICDINVSAYLKRLALKERLEL